LVFVPPGKISLRGPDYQTEKAHNICETLVKPSALAMVRTVLGEESERKLMAIPSSDSTVKKRTALVANDMKVQVVTGVEKS